ncbi:MAG TPA: ABC transporter permease [Terracidiphilus sp.]|nr:ABC transporter permease [Terracidiphilus sp.]
MKWWQLRRRDADLERELRSDLELEAEEQRERGLPADDARLAARRALGNAVLIRERTHEAWGWAPVERFYLDLRYAMRQLRTSPGFTFAVIATLALGIGATTAIFTLVYCTLLRGLPYPESDRIMRIDDVRLQGQSGGGLMRVPRFFDLQARNKSFESVAFFYFENVTLISGTRMPAAIRSATASGGFWKVFGTRPLLGRAFNERDDQPKAPPVVVLSFKSWQEQFHGDPSVVGSHVTIDQKAATIIGVMPAEVNVPNGIDLWRPAQFDPGEFTWRGAGSGFLNVFALMRPGVTIAAAESDLQRVGAQLQHEYAGTDGNWQFAGRSFRDSLYGQLRPALMVLWAASGFLFLMACINVANLLLTRATEREREVALRRALGASEGRLRLQFLTENTLLALIGGAAGLGLAWTLIRIAAARLPGRLGVQGIVEMNWPVVGFACVVALVSGVVFGLAPVLRNGDAALNASLKRGDKRAGAFCGGWVRGGFIAVQVGLSLVLLVGASLLGESLWNLIKLPLGFAPNRLLTFEISLPWGTDQSAIRSFFLNAQQRIEALPGVVAVGQIDALPTVDWHLRSNFDADWLPRVANHPAFTAEDRHIAGNYLAAMSTPVLMGRGFTDEDQRPESRTILVNHELVREYLPGGDAVGRHLMIDEHSFQIVGVIGDVRGTTGPISKAPGPEVYWPADSDIGVVQRYFAVQSRVPPNELINSIREQVREVDPMRAISNVSTMDELLDHSVAQPRLNMALIASFAALALLLACVGIYGIVAWSAQQRVQEIGVRMALGATRAQIALMFMKRAALPTFIGMATGTGVALLLTQLLRSQLYGVTPGNPRTYALSMFLLSIPVLVATLRPSLRAASINPVDALRNE